VKSVTIVSWIRWKRQLKRYRIKSASRRTVFDLSVKQEELHKLEQETQKEGFWRDQKHAQELTSRIAELKEDCTRWEKLQKDTSELLELAALHDESLAGDIEDRYNALYKEYVDAEKKLFLSGPHDKGSTVVSLYAGAGGQDAEEWAAILYRMYTRVSERKGWRHTILHEHRNEHGGLKNATIEMIGPYAYGLLKKERGVHRLVRISPYSAKKLRHTSFAFVEVLPVFTETGNIDIKAEDLDVSFARSSGPGGQNVNKRSTAVRLMHKPTGIQVHVDSGRSQSGNREKALKILEAKLMHVMETTKKKEVESIKGANPVKIEWGNQIRSYVFHPYKLVKDHRTNVETSSVDEVLDGVIDAFIDAEIRLEVGTKK